jgi:diketogulonate reductase-like aldo/keto reductase
MAAADVPVVSLNDGTSVPRVGFGVYRVPSEEAQAVVAEALSAGYRFLDTAKLYENEAGVGGAIAESRIPRDELYVTTKVWNDDQGYDATRRAFDRSMAELGLDVLDLYLIHWPYPGQDLYVQTYRALIALQEEGRLRSVGVSNFQPAHLERIIGETGVVPVVNQVELHPHLQQAELRAFHAEHGIVTEAWAPLGAGKGPLDEPVLADVAAAHGVSPAQVVLRWQLDLGNVIIPKSSNPARMRENLELWGFELTDDDRAEIAALDRGADGRNGPDPDRFGA